MTSLLVHTYDIIYIFFFRVDTTDTGHILGQAKYRNLAPFPERSLKPVNCAVMKLLLHMAMYIGTNNNAQVSKNK